MNRYSPEECEMFLEVYPNSAKLMEESVKPTTLYRMAVTHCFINNSQGYMVDNLRNAAKAVLVDFKPHRMTDEFNRICINGKLQNKLVEEFMDGRTPGCWSACGGYEDGDYIELYFYNKCEDYSVKAYYDEQGKMVIE